MTAPPETIFSACALIYDIRGYSTAARRVPAAQFGGFVADAHAAIVRTLSVRPPDFAKNLGDGMFLLWRIEAGEAPGFLADLGSAALRAQREYRAMAASQSFAGMENLPRDVGFGISWGPVTHRDDYYGQTINMAARLQDRARPRGVIFDEATYERIPADRRAAWETPVIRVRAKLKGVGPTTYRWIVRLTRGEVWSRHTRRIARRVGPVLLPVLLFLWIDGGLPIPFGAGLRGAIDATGMSLLRPREEMATLDRRAAEMRAGAIEVLRTRLDAKTGRVFPGPDRAPDFFAWTDGAVLATLLSRPLKDDEKKWAQACLDQLFEGAPGADGKPVVEFVRGEGWWRHPTERTPHFECTAWVFLACIRAHAEPSLDADPRLAERTRLAYEAVAAYHDPACGGWHWKIRQAPANIYGDPEPTNEHYVSHYNAVMALWTLVEAERLHVAEVAEPARKAGLIASTVSWLLDKYIPEARGWGGEWMSTEPATISDYRDGLTFQIFWALLQAEAHAGAQLPAWVGRDLHSRLLETLTRDIHFPTDRHKWIVNLFPTSQDLDRFRAGDRASLRSLVRARDTVDFFWIPWAYAAARARLARGALSRRERVELERVLTHLSGLAEKEYAIGHDSWVYRLYELAQGLSPGNTPEPLPENAKGH